MPRRVVAKPKPTRKADKVRNFALASGLLVAIATGTGMGISRPLGPDYAAMKASTVELWVGESHEHQDGHGSGVIISPNFVLTVWHVATIHDDGRMHVLFADGSSGEAVTVWSDQSRDVAIMALTRATRFPAARMAGTAPKTGDAIYAAGYPLHLPLSVQEGKMASDSPPLGLASVIPQAGSTLIVNCTILRGDSGGPVYNAAGEVIGLNDMDFVDILAGMFPTWTDMAGIVGMQYIRADVRAVTGV